MRRGLLQTGTGGDEKCRGPAYFWVTFWAASGMDTEYAVLVTCRKCVSWGFPDRSLARLVACRCGVRLAAGAEEKGDVGRGSSFAGALHRGMRRGIPPDGRDVVAAAAGCGAREALRSVPGSERAGRQVGGRRRVCLSHVPSNARVGSGAGRDDRGLGCPPHRSDLRVGAGDRESVSTICVGVDVRFVWHTAGCRTGIQ